MGTVFRACCVEQTCCELLVELMNKKWLSRSGASWACGTIDFDFAIARDDRAGNQVQLAKVSAGLTPSSLTPARWKLCHQPILRSLPVTRPFSDLLSYRGSSYRGTSVVIVVVVDARRAETPAITDVRRAVSAEALANNSPMTGQRDGNCVCLP